jgi:hypothetical protein
MRGRAVRQRLKKQVCGNSCTGVLIVTGGTFEVPDVVVGANPDLRAKGAIMSVYVMQCKGTHFLAAMTRTNKQYWFLKEAMRFSVVVHKLVNVTKRLKGSRTKVPTISWWQLALLENIILNAGSLMTAIYILDTYI